MTFGSTFGRVFSPTFQPKSVAAAGGGWWDLDGTITSCVAAYQPKGAASYAASLVNLTGNTTYDAITAFQPAWDNTNGWQFDGINDHLRVDVIPDTDQSYSAIVRYSNPNLDDYDWVFGVMVTGVGTFGFGRGKSSAPIKFANGGQVAVNVAIPSSAVAAIAGNQGYLDGTTCGGTMSGYSEGSMRKVYIGCLHSANDSHSSHADIDIQAFAIYSGILTPTQVGLLSTAMNAL